MGIPYYFYNIYKKYNNLVIDQNYISKIDIDYLFLDYNSLIHPCAQEVIKSKIKDENLENENLENENLENENLEDEKIKDENLENDIIKNCMIYTRYIIDTIGAKNVYIMIDGVAPRAKMNQQRERRYKTYFLKKINSKEKSENNIEWDSNKITPGTFFMESIKNALYKLKNDVEDFCNIHISDSNECGEGEHKMMKCITELEPKNKVCIYGLDADLIMLSLMNKYFDKIVLFRDNTSEKTYTYLDISKLKKNICNELYSELNNIGTETFIEKNDDNIICDYLFLCFLLGNDFLEHIPTLMIKENGISVLLKYYINLLFKKKSYLININAIKNNNLEESIDLQFLQDIFYQLSKSEEFFYNKVYSVYKNNNKNKDVYKDVYKDTFDINNNYDDIYIYKEDIIKYNTVGYKKRYYDFYGVNNINHINNSCKDYINGLYWILGYYNNHMHNNWTWFYKYNAIPFSSDIFQYLLKSDKKQILKKDTIQKTKSNTPLEQLMMVLPKLSLLDIIKNQDNHLYKKLIRIFNTYSKELDEFYPNKICLDMIHKEFMWQSKIFLKDFKDNLLEKFI
jgi:5'-3' exonuclease